MSYTSISLALLLWPCLCIKWEKKKERILCFRKILRFNKTKGTEKESPCFTSFYRKKQSLKIEAYLCNLFNIYHIFGILRIGANYLCASCHLVSKTSHSSDIHYIKTVNVVQQNQEKPPEEAAPPASFAYQKQDPTDLVQLSQYQIPWYLL